MSDKTYFIFQTLFTKVRDLEEIVKKNKRRR